MGSDSTLCKPSHWQSLSQTNIRRWSSPCPPVRYNQPSPGHIFFFPDKIYLPLVMGKQTVTVLGAMAINIIHHIHTWAFFTICKKIYFILRLNGYFSLHTFYPSPPNESLSSLLLRLDRIFIVSVWLSPGQVLATRASPPRLSSHCAASECGWWRPSWATDHPSPSWVHRSVFNTEHYN